MVFSIDLLKAAVAERAANWSQYTPGQFPTSVVSATAPSKYELVIKLDRAYNPSYFLDDQLQASNGVYPLPATSWNIDRSGGPHLDYTNPANAKKIYDFLSRQGSDASGFATNPLWQDVDGPYKLSSFSATDGSYRLAPNPRLRGWPRPVRDDADQHLPVDHRAAERAAVRRPGRRQHRLLAARRGRDGCGPPASACSAGHRSGGSAR